jgi:CheY-like chemotaxis protein
MRKKIRILSVEDDPLQAEWIRDTIEGAISGAEVECIENEQEFCKRLDDIAKEPPAVILMDVMLRWTNPAPRINPPPPDVRDGGFYRAGLRCQRLLALRESTKSVPVILYTVLDRSDLEGALREPVGQIEFLRKEADPESLLAAVRSAIRRR